MLPHLSGGWRLAAGGWRWRLALAAGAGGWRPTCRLQKTLFEGPRLEGDPPREELEELVELLQLRAEVVVLKNLELDADDEPVVVIRVIHLSQRKRQQLKSKPCLSKGRAPAQ
jgi:hypothetical protein